MRQLFCVAGAEQNTCFCMIFEKIFPIYVEYSVDISIDYDKIKTLLLKFKQIEKRVMEELRS